MSVPGRCLSFYYTYSRQLYSEQICRKDGPPAENRNLTTKFENLTVMHILKTLFM